MISQKNWTAFCQQQANPDEEVVREFYASLISSDQVTVMVREQLVPFSAVAMNQLFRLEDMEDD